MENFSQYLPLINSSVIAIGGIAVVVIYVFNNKSNVSSTVIDNYKELDSQKTKQIEALQHDIEEIKASMRATEKGFIERIAKLEGQLKEKNNQIDSLNKILANRNPELETVLGEIKDFMAGIYKQNKHQTTILEAGVESNKLVADNLFNRNKTADARNDLIDEATESEEGHVLRK